MQIAHDLHDGLGGSLMRSMALVELAPQPLANQRVLSLLKVLRDDLRQVIDHGSSAGAQVPDTPVQQAAPLRHRFTLLFDEMGVASQWRIAPQWQGRPSALQCLGPDTVGGRGAVERPQAQPGTACVRAVHAAAARHLAAAHCRRWRGL